MTARSLASLTAIAVLAAGCASPGQTVDEVGFSLGTTSHSFQISRAGTVTKINSNGRYESMNCYEHGLDVIKASTQNTFETGMQGSTRIPVRDLANYAYALNRITQQCQKSPNPMPEGHYKAVSAALTGYSSQVTAMQASSTRIALKR